jgi:uncharacterized membrane protein YfcA
LTVVKPTPPSTAPVHNGALALALGAPVGLLGGLIGLGGAEFRLPILVSIFRYAASRAVPLNLAVSLVTVSAAVVTRLSLSTMQPSEHFTLVIGSMILGGMIGAYTGATWIGRISEHLLERVILMFLVAIGGLLMIEGFFSLESAGLPLNAIGRIATGIVCGIGIGVVSSLLGVAGGELIIPTLMLIFGVEIKTAGTASLLISLPTMVVGIARHHANGAFTERQDLTLTVAPMGIGSLIGAVAGGALMLYVPRQALKILLGAILIGSAIKIFRK